MLIAISLQNVTFIYTLIIRIFCIGLVISTFEYFYTIEQYSNEGIFSWRIFKLTGSISNYFLKKLDFIFQKNGLKVILLIRLISSFFLIVAPITLYTAFFLFAIAVSSMIITFRNIVGNDGSDQMNSIICITLFITFLSKNLDIAKIGLFFICAQSILSYLVSGIAKSLSHKWRNGMAIYEIMNTKTYGSKKISRYLKGANKLVNLTANWNIILFECFFFLVILLPTPYLFIFIVWGFIFHLYNAIFMGLNGFFWAFLATYPAIIYVAYTLVAVRY